MSAEKRQVLNNLKMLRQQERKRMLHLAVLNVYIYIIHTQTHQESSKKAMVCFKFCIWFLREKRNEEILVHCISRQPSRYDSFLVLRQSYNRLEYSILFISNYSIQFAKWSSVLYLFLSSKLICSSFHRQVQTTDNNLDMQYKFQMKNKIILNIHVLIWCFIILHMKKIAFYYHSCK